MNHLTVEQQTTTQQAERRRTLEPLASPTGTQSPSYRTGQPTAVQRSRRSGYQWGWIVVMSLAVAIALIGAQQSQQTSTPTDPRGPDAPPPAVLIQEG